MVSLCVVQHRATFSRIKVKVRILDIAPLRESSPQKRSGVMFSRDLTVLPAHPHVHLQSEWAISAFAFPAIAGTYLPTPEGWKAELAWLVTYLSARKQSSIPLLTGLNCVASAGQVKFDRRAHAADADERRRRRHTRERRRRHHHRSHR